MSSFIEKTIVVPFYVDENEVRFPLINMDLDEVRGPTFPILPFDAGVKSHGGYHGDTVGLYHTTQGHVRSGHPIRMRVLMVEMISPNGEFLTADTISEDQFRGESNALFMVQVASKKLLNKN